VTEEEDTCVSYDKCIPGSVERLCDCELSYDMHVSSSSAYRGAWRGFVTVNWSSTYCRGRRKPSLANVERMLFLCESLRAPAWRALTHTHTHTHTSRARARARAHTHTHTHLHDEL